jgi:hypothetical protein
MPVYEDWASAAEVCRRMDASIGELNIGELNASVDVVLINDGSETGSGPTFTGIQLRHIDRISVLDLHRNLGHQRAIAIGLAYASEHLSADALVIMDGDGEDPPEQIPVLVREAARLRFSGVLFAQRGRRVEGWMFRAFYLVYRMLHRVVTGRGIAVGNFSVLPWRLLPALVAHPEIWNHYAAAVLQSRLPRAMIRLDRGRRIYGQSKMRFTDLVMHGLAALFAYHEVVSTRLLLGTVALVLLTAGALTALLASGAVKSLNQVTIVMVVIVLVGQFSTVALLAAFLAVMNRSAQQFLPARDYGYFVRGFTPICARDAGEMPRVGA